MTMWIARDKDRTLTLFENKPVKNDEGWIATGKKENLVFEDLWFPEVKWSDKEPRELILK